MPRVLFSVVSFLVAFYFTSATTRSLLTPDGEEVSAESQGSSPWDAMPSPRANNASVQQGMRAAQYANRHNVARGRQIANGIQNQSYGSSSSRRSGNSGNPYLNGVGHIHKPKPKPAPPAIKGKVTSNPYAVRKRTTLKTGERSSDCRFRSAVRDDSDVPPSIPQPLKNSFNCVDVEIRNRETAHAVPWPTFQIAKLRNAR